MERALETGETVHREAKAYGDGSVETSHTTTVGPLQGYRPQTLLETVHNMLAVV